MNVRKARKAYDRLPAREKRRLQKRYACSRSPWRIIALLVLVALLLFFLAPYFFG